MTSLIVCTPAPAGTHTAQACSAQSLRPFLDELPPEVLNHIVSFLTPSLLLPLIFTRPFHDLPHVLGNLPFRALLLYDTSKEAALHGHTPLLSWLADKMHYPLMTSHCDLAARGGHLKTLQWLRSRSIAWDERTTMEAACGGYLEVLKWAHENGCPWDIRTTEVAFVHGYTACYEYACEKGCTSARFSGLKWAP